MLNIRAATVQSKATRFCSSIFRMQATSHQRSMEAEAREILKRAVTDIPAQTMPPPRTPEEMRERLRAATGIWKDRGTTGELMRLTRGED